MKLNYYLLITAWKPFDKMLKSNFVTLRRTFALKILFEAHAFDHKFELFYSKLLAPGCWQTNNWRLMRHICNTGNLKSPGWKASRIQAMFFLKKVMCLTYESVYVYICVYLYLPLGVFSLVDVYVYCTKTYICIVQKETTISIEQNNRFPNIS